MTKILYVMRHGEADMAADDFNRPLASIAQQQISRYNDISINIDLLLCSPAKRTMQTHDLLQNIDVLQYNKSRFNEHFYLASAQTWLHEIIALPNDVNTVMILAHNPGLSDLLQRLMPDYHDYLNTAGLVKLEYNDLTSWNIIETAKASLILY